MGEQVIQNVADTAFLIAAHRAVETERSDALFRDPLARRLAGERGQAIVAKLRRRVVTGWSVAVRTVVIDDLIQAALARGADTVLNLGAGLDTRPYRMALPGALRWIEVDYPQTVDFKETQLASETPRCRLERVRLDLADVAARRRLFAEIGARAKHALVLTEGVIPYLETADAGVLADDLRAVDAFRGSIVDYFSPETVRYRARDARDFENAPFKFAPDDWAGFFQAHGWRAAEKRFLFDEGLKLGRPMPLPLAMRVWIRALRLFAPPERREGMRRFAGYFLMERS